MLSSRLFGARRFRLLCYSFFLIVSFVILTFFSSEHVQAGASVACQGNTLQISWDSLLTPVTIRVNGTDAVTGGPANGSTLVIGPGSWTVEIFQNGDPVGTYTAGCPGSQPAPRDPNRIDNGSDAGLNVPFKRKGGGFDLYTYNPKKQNSVVVFSLSCEQQAGAARQSALLHAKGQIPNVHLFTGKDYQGREVSVWFVYPDQIQVNGYFDDGKPHSFNFAACADARQFAVPTPTSIALPKLTIVASCKGNVATFVVTNNGGDMREQGRYVISVPPARIVGGGAIQLRAEASETLTVQGHYATLTANVQSGGGGASVQAQTTCVRPKISVVVTCKTTTYIVTLTNQGGDMLQPGSVRIGGFIGLGERVADYTTSFNLESSKSLQHEFPYNGKLFSGFVFIDETMKTEFTCGPSPRLVLVAFCNQGQVTFAIQNYTASTRRAYFTVYDRSNPRGVIEETAAVRTTNIALTPWEARSIGPIRVQPGHRLVLSAGDEEGYVYDIVKAC